MKNSKYAELTTEKMKQIRKELSVSEGFLCKSVGLHPNRISQLRSDNRRIPKDEQLKLWEIINHLRKIKRDGYPTLKTKDQSRARNRLREVADDLGNIKTLINGKMTASLKDTIIKYLDNTIMRINKTLNE